MRSLSTALAALALTLVPATASATPSLADVSASLAGRRECVAFRWLPNDTGSERGGISVPVEVNGRTLPMQLDTGANATSLYGRYPVAAGWAKPGVESFRATRFAVAGRTVDRPQLYVNAEMAGEADLRGTLGLPALFGRIAVIDYPGRRFCLFDEADLPPVLETTSYVRAMLRGGKLFVPIRSGGFASDTIVFDTGSSEMPLHVDLAVWKRLTRRATTDAAPAAIKGLAWGKPFTLAGAPAAAPVMLGEAGLGSITVFTNPDAPDSFADWPMRTEGVLGNASLWDGIVILDLTAKMRFAWVHGGAARSSSTEEDGPRHVAGTPPGVSNQ